jgi:D-threo-aldose 1-dehydrogenase
VGSERIAIDAARLPLGFGCSTLTYHANEAEAIHILEEAFALGITHFDVARSYGGGRAEGILGRFVRGRRSQLYLVTKCGFQPAARGPGASRSILVTRSAGVESLYRKARGWARKYVRRPYSPANVRHSLETSLRELGTDYVDCLLLHEAHVDEANKRSLIAELERILTEGKIRSFGLGSEFKKLRETSSRLAPEFSVLQFEHNTHAQEGLASGIQHTRTVFTHSALKSLAQISQQLVEVPSRLSLFLKAVGLDRCRRAVLGGVLLAYSNALNPSGRVIFSTTSCDHLRENTNVVRQYLSWDLERKRSLARLFDRCY